MLLDAILLVLQEIEYSGAAHRRGIHVSPSIKNEIIEILTDNHLVTEVNSIVYITNRGINFINFYGLTQNLVQSEVKNKKAFIR